MTSVKDLVKISVIILFIFFLSIFLTINISPILYGLAVYHFHLNDVSSLSGASLMKCYFFMLKYLQVPWDTKLNLIFFKSSIKGLIHFKNVKQLVMFNNVGMLLLGGLGSYFIEQYYYTHFLWKLINPLKAMLTGILVFMGIAFVNFQAFFINFHRIMFRNQDWVFDAHIDPIITVLPTAFFAWCFITFVVILVMILSLLIYYSK